MAVVELTAVCLVSALVGLGALHLYWGLGGSRYRQFATPRVDGQPTAAPGGFAFLAVAAVLWSAALTVLSRIGAFDGPGFHGTATIWLWIFAGLFACRAIGDFRLIGVFCHRVDRAHRKLEHEFTVPLCLILSLAFVRLALLPGLN